MSPLDSWISSPGEDDPTGTQDRTGVPRQFLETTRVLLIEHDAEHARRIQTMVTEVGERGFEPLEIDWASDLPQGLRRIERAHAVILDLSLPDSAGLASLEELNRRVDKPVVVLLKDDCDRLALEGLRGRGQEAVAGAHDSLVKGRFDGETLVRSVRYAVERHGLIRQLRQAQKMEIVGRLASGIAHDFSNIVTAISLHAEHLRRNILPTDPLIERARDIQQAARRGSRLTNQLLAFSCRQAWHPEVVDLNVTVREVGAFYQRVLGEDIAVSESLARGLGRVRADPNQLEQIILNLVANARDAMPNGGQLRLYTANITVEPGQTASRGSLIEAGRYVQLAIEDTGHGMDPVTLEQIFDPSYNPEERGRGFGLSTVYGIIRQIGGYIRVESEESVGTRFTVLLPRVEEPLSVSAEGSEVISLGGSETILLVEDAADLRPLIAESLRQRGYDVLEAGSAKCALAIARAHRGDLDLIIADLIMPDGRAPELIAGLRGERPDVKVLLMSGYIDEDTFSQDSELARLPFIEKPFRTSELSLQVRQVLDDDGVFDGTSM